MAQSCTIRHLHLSLLTPRDQPDQDALGARVRDAVVASLRTALPQALSGLGGEGVLRIAHMDIDLTLDAALTPDAIAERLVESIAHNVFRARHDGEQVMSYAGRAEFLAAFLIELVRGTAWQRWWFKTFDGVRPLSISAAVRTSILAQPHEGLAALLCLPPHELTAVLGILQPVDAARSLHEIAEQRPDLERNAAVAAVLAVRRGAPAPLAEPRAAALFAFIEAARRDKAHACGRVASILLALAELEKMLAPLPAVRRGAFLAAIGTAGHVERPAELNAAVLARLAPLIALPRGLRTEIMRSLDVAESVGGPVTGEIRHTHFGGLFLLLASLELRLLEEACAAADWDDDVPLAGVIALLTLAACAGRARAAALLSDSVWRDLFDIPARLWLAEMGERLAALPATFWESIAALGAPPASLGDARYLLLPRRLSGSGAASHALARLARALLTRLTRRLPGARAASAPALWCNLLSGGARIEAGAQVWTVTLARPPLDILLSLSGIADAELQAPRRLRLRREAA